MSAHSRSETAGRARRPVAAVAVLAQLGADTAAYLRHPGVTSRRVMRSRDLRVAAAVTAAALLVTALGFGVTPAPRDPPARVSRFLALGLTWMSLHRVALTALLTVALLAVTAIGYTGTCLLVARWRAPGTATDWTALLVGIAYLNCVSLLSALVPFPAIVLQLAGVGAWRAVNAVTLPLSVVLGAYVAVPAWFAVREAGGLGPGRAALALALPSALAVAVVGGATVAGLAVAFG
jgi:hypothetical protein